MYRVGTRGRDYTRVCRGRCRGNWKRIRTAPACWLSRSFITGRCYRDLYRAQTRAKTKKLVESCDILFSRVYGYIYFLSRLEGGHFSLHGVNFATKKKNRSVGARKRNDAIWDNETINFADARDVRRTRMLARSVASIENVCRLRKKCRIERVR